MSAAQSEKMRRVLAQWNLAISRLVDAPSLGYVASYGRAEILMGSFTDVVRSLVQRYMPEDIERGMAMITAPGRMRMELHPARVPIH